MLLSLGNHISCKRQKGKCNQKHQWKEHITSTLMALVMMMMMMTLSLPAALAKEEGDSCSMKNIQGECLTASKCYDRIDQYIKEGKLKQSEVVSCGLGPREEIICCPLELNTRTNKRASEVACDNVEAHLPALLSPHIISGTPVDPEEYPHMAAIAFSNIGGGEEYTFRCGGTLIEKRFVLTAAHCVINVEDKPLFVRLGVINLVRDKNGVDVEIADVHIHKNYSQSSKYHDIAILELRNDVPYSPKIYPSCLYSELNDPPSTMEYYVAGWGTINQKTRETSDILLKARLNIVSLEQCNQSFAIASGGIHRQLAQGLQQTQLCAYDPGYTKDACNGDSGGPLIMVRDASRKSYRIVGIVSVGFGCASRTPGLYTRVAAYLDYIESIVWPGQ